MFASFYNHPEVVEKLLAAGAQPDHQQSVSSWDTSVNSQQTIKADSGFSQHRKNLIPWGNGSSPLAS